jgi:hypothetical protein
MPWYRTGEGYLRYAKPRSGRAALYDRRGYTALGEQAPSELLTTELPAPFDVSAHNVDECLTYARQHPRQMTELLNAEKAGQDRVTLIEGLKELVAQGQRHQARQQPEDD